MRLLVLGAFALFAWGTITLAADPPAAPTPTFPAPLPHPVAAPAAPPAPVGESCTAPASTSDKSHHLLKAAEHLETAGMSCEAKALRQQAKELRAELLKQKRAELQQLQAEIAALEQANPAAKQVLLKVQAVEVSLTNMKALGFDVNTLHGQPLSNSTPPQVGEGKPRDSLSFGVVDRDSVNRLVDALVKEDIAKVLAEPKLVTVDRRPASYFVGGEVRTVVPQPGESPHELVRKVGTEIDFLPILHSDGKLRCEIRVRVSQVDPSLDVKAGDNTIPGFRVAEIDTGLEIMPGQTAALAGLTQQRIIMKKNANNEKERSVNNVELLLFVTPELIDPPITAASPHAPAPK
jgi:Flp pilus assembly secretin CpaC